MSMRVRIVPIGAGGPVGLLTAASLESGARGNLVFDAQIVALCREHGISTILTSDRGFRRFENPRVRLLGELV